MKFGIFSVVDHYPTELQRSSTQFYNELLEQAELADELGFDSFWLAEHHFHQYGIIPRPSLFLAAAAQRTKQIKLGASVVVLPFDNPIRIAEDFAMLDMLSNGRLCMGVGSGYLQHEFDGFGVHPSEKRARFDEALSIILEAWKGKPFSFEGEHHSYKDICLNIESIQKPHPLLTVAILSNKAAYYVGKRGLPIMMIPYATTESFDELSSTVSEFRQGFKESGQPIEKAIVPFGLHTFCGESFEAVQPLCKEMMDRYVRTRLYAKQRPFEHIVEKDLVAFGGPADIIRVAKKYEAAGLTHMLSIMNFGGMPHKKVLASMRLMAKEVFPAFEE